MLSFFLLAHSHIFLKLEQIFKWKCDAWEEERKMCESVACFNVNIWIFIVNYIGAIHCYRWKKICSSSDEYTHHICICIYIRATTEFHFFNQDYCVIENNRELIRSLLLFFLFSLFYFSYRLFPSHSQHKWFIKCATSHDSRTLKFILQAIP